MREIKFRVWDRQNKKMSLVSSINYADDGFAKTISVIPAPKAKFHYSLVHGENGELMQFTGFIDDEGKEIYEGDLLKFNHDGYDVVKPIEFNNGGFWIKNEVAQNHLPFKRTVVGNIYETPELIKN